SISPSERFFVFLRSVALRSGVSPLQVLMFVGMAGLILSMCHIRRVYLLSDCALPRSGFLGFSGSSFQGIRDQEEAVWRWLYATSLDLPGAYLLIILVASETIFYLWEAHWFTYALDGIWFGCLYLAAAVVVYTSLFFFCSASFGYGR